MEDYSGRTGQQMEPGQEENKLQSNKQLSYETNDRTKGEITNINRMEDFN